MLARGASPTDSIRSVASSRAGTLSRPPPPSKPSHLSSANTGTCNSVALRHYIETHTTGGSFTTHSLSTATISRAHLGHGYDSSTIDHFVDAFGASSDEEDATQPQSASRPSVRARTYTAPSVSRVFDPSSNDADIGEGTTRLIRNEPIAINAAGASRVGNLRNMFEAATGAAPSALLSRQNTGVKPQHTGTKAKPRISSQVRMLQAQITGDRFNGLAGTFHVADARSSVVMQQQHQRDVTADSIGSSIFHTASQSMLGDALKMDAVVIPPASHQDTLRASPSSSLPSAESVFASHMGDEPSTIDTNATISRSSSAKTGLTASLFRNVQKHHYRDDSDATIRPTNSTEDEANDASSVAGTVRRRTSHQVSKSHKDRLSSILTASPQSDRNGSGGRNTSNGITHSPSGMSIASSSAFDAESERSREPSMLLADDEDIEFSKTSHRLRVKDGSCFDLDWGSSASPTKSGSMPQMLNAAAASSTPCKTLTDSNGGMPSKEETQLEEATIDANPRRETRGEAAVPSLLPSPSIVVETKASANDDYSKSSDAAEPIATNSSMLIATSGAPRPISANQLRPGMGKPARALYDFEGEPAFNELVIRAGQPFDVINEQLAGGWCLGVVWDEQGVPTRGLIPQGWYCIIQDFTMSPSVSQMNDLPPKPAGINPPDVVVPDQGGDKEEKHVVVEEERRASGIVESVSQFLDMRPEPKASTVVEETAAEEAVSAEEEKSQTPELQLSRSASSDSTPSELLPPTPTSAPLATGSGQAHWQQAADDRQPVVQAPAAVDYLSADIMEDRFPSPGKLVDGLPTASNESNPINWSKIASSQTSGTASDTMDASAVPQVNAETVQGPKSDSDTTSATVTSPTADWKGSLFGGKTLNRFASFVTSGAEDYVLSNSNPVEDDDRTRTMARKVSNGQTAALAQVVEEEEEAPVEATAPTQLIMGRTKEGLSPNPAHHFVIAGPAGPKWKSKSPPFLVQVHHPEKRTKLNGMHEYTIYHVTSTYPLDADACSDSCLPYDPLGGPWPPGEQVTVVRRYTQFEWLAQVLARNYSALPLPPLPEKQYAGRFAGDFIETRRADLEMWISRLVRHPILRSSPPLQFFLSCEGDAKWRAGAAVLLKQGDGAKGVFAQTWHPEFNFDAGEAEDEAERMEAFLCAQEKTLNGIGGGNAGRQGMLAAYKGFREQSVGCAGAYRDLSYTLLRTITGMGAGPGDGAEGGVEDEEAHRIHGPPMGNLGKRSETGATNENGAWCWRQECADCTNLTSALQNTAETLQTVADMYDTHARETLLRQHERVKDVSRPLSHANALLDTHRSTLKRYVEVTCDPVAFVGGEAEADDQAANETLAARCETVLNVTLAEMDRIHDERVEDFHGVGRRLLEGEIELYEAILEQLKAARLHYDEEYYEREEGLHILSSRYQPELARREKPCRPLLMPSAAHSDGGGLRRGLFVRQASVLRPVSSVGGGGSGEALMDDEGETERNRRERGSASYFSAIWR